MTALVWHPSTVDGLIEAASARPLPPTVRPGDATNAQASTFTARYVIEQDSGFRPGRPDEAPAFLLTIVYDNHDDDVHEIDLGQHYPDLGDAKAAAERYEHTGDVYADADTLRYRDANLNARFLPQTHATTPPARACTSAVSRSTRTCTNALDSWSSRSTATPPTQPCSTPTGACHCASPSATPRSSTPERIGRNSSRRQKGHRTVPQSMSPVEYLAVRPDQLLTQNACVRRDGIFNWCLPAWAGRLADGRTYNTCPSAGICAKVCYARAGTYRFRNVLERHERNLAYLLDDLPGWTAQMIDEIHRKRRPIIVRIHDAGDFFSAAYLDAWREVMAANRASRFYSYTKEIVLFQRHIEPDPPRNFKWVYSYGGIHDALLDEHRQRVVDVFPTVAALQDAGYNDQSASDLLAVDGPTPVGIPANNIRHFLKRQGDRTFRTWQEEVDTARATRRPAPPPDPATAPLSGPTDEPDPWGPLLQQLAAR